MTRSTGPLSPNTLVGKCRSACPIGQIDLENNAQLEQKEAEFEGKIQQNQWFQQLKKSCVPRHLLYL
ncbi:MAG: hypothetical protein P2A85_13685 [Microcoleus anatoxicus]|uniref:hypothetical protein n=1 Tax=Microcoleus anatoxicus TaxID=2705319 RepID=UPI00366CA568